MFGFSSTSEQVLVCYFCQSAFFILKSKLIRGDCCSLYTWFCWMLLCVTMALPLSLVARLHSLAIPPIYFKKVDNKSKQYSNLSITTISWLRRKTFAKSMISCISFSFQWITFYQVPLFAQVNSLDFIIFYIKLNCIWLELILIMLFNPSTMDCTDKLNLFFYTCLWIGPVCLVKSLSWCCRNRFQMQQK